MEFLPLQLTDVFPLQLAGGPSLWRTEFLPVRLAGLFLPRQDVFQFQLAGVASGPG